MNLVFHYLGLSYLLSHPFSIWFPSPAVSRRDACLWAAKSVAPFVVALPVFGMRNWIWHVLLPSIFFCFFNTPKNAAEHDYLYAGDSYGGTQEEVTRSIRASALTRFFWCNCMYHIEHHLYPAVPFHHLPAVSRLRRAREKPESYLTFSWLRLVRGVQYPFFI